MKWTKFWLYNLPMIKLLKWRKNALGVSPFDHFLSCLLLNHWNLEQCIPVFDQNSIKICLSIWIVQQLFSLTSGFSSLLQSYLTFIFPLQNLLMLYFLRTTSFHSFMINLLFDHSSYYISNNKIYHLFITYYVLNTLHALVLILKTKMHFGYYFLHFTDNTLHSVVVEWFVHNSRAIIYPSQISNTGLTPWKLLFAWLFYAVFLNPLSFNDPQSHRVTFLFHKNI